MTSVYERVKRSEPMDIIKPMLKNMGKVPLCCCIIDGDLISCDRYTLVRKLYFKELCSQCQAEIVYKILEAKK